MSNETQRFEKTNRMAKPNIGMPYHTNQTNTNRMLPRPRMNCMCGNGKRLSKSIQDRRRYENKVEIETCHVNALNERCYNWCRWGWWQNWWNKREDKDKVKECYLRAECKMVNIHNWKLEPQLLVFGHQVAPLAKVNNRYRKHNKLGRCGSWLKRVGARRCYRI